MRVKIATETQGSIALAEAVPPETVDQIRETGLDPSECYRVRDLDFAKEDARFYFTDGYLIFGKPVNGAGIPQCLWRRGGGDAEVRFSAEPRRRLSWRATDRRTSASISSSPR
jgi:hypothetical protein